MWEMQTQTQTQMRGVDGREVPVLTERWMSWVWMVSWSLYALIAQCLRMDGWMDGWSLLDRSSRDYSLLRHRWQPPVSRSSLNHNRYSSAHIYTHTITAMTDHTPLAVFITTFNMNMRSSKLSDHELRSWLAPAFKGQGKEPELLVIGIQELLPLELARMSRHSQPYGSLPSSLTCSSGFS